MLTHGNVSVRMLSDDKGISGIELHCTKCERRQQLLADITPVEEGNAIIDEFLNKHKNCNNSEVN